MVETVIAPQKGYQTKVLTSKADIVIGGSGAGVGKTFSLLMDFLRGINNPKYGGVIFRRTTPQITNEGGLWDTSEDLFNLIPQSKSIRTRLSWKFESGAKLKFSHLEYEKDKISYQGSQICMIGFDELTHFTESQFFYLLSRNRSTCGIRPFVRATCNPDSESWVANFIEWWICQDKHSPMYGLPIPEREGVVRYFTRGKNNVFVWGDTPEEVVDNCPEIAEVVMKSGKDPKDLIKSLTFISGDIYENKQLIDQDPGYLASLLSLEEDLKNQLLGGNWKIKISDSNLFDYWAVSSLDSNFYDLLDNNGQVIAQKKDSFVSCDVAGEGDDLAVVMGWEGYRIKHIRILTTCKQPELEKEIEIVRNQVMATKYNTIVDTNGMGTGVVQYGGYTPFLNNGKAIDPPEAKGNVNFRANYENLKTQCAYKAAESILEGDVSLKDVTIFVDGVRTEYVHMKGQGNKKVIELIKQELNAVKKITSDGKKKITKKSDIKKLINRSPDFLDTILERFYYDLIPEQDNSFKSAKSNSGLAGIRNKRF